MMPGRSHAPKSYARATSPWMPVYFVPSQVPTGVSVTSLLSFRSIRAFSPTRDGRRLHDVQIGAVVGDVDLRVVAHRHLRRRRQRLAEHERAAGRGGRTGIGVGAVERQRARAGLGHAAADVGGEVRRRRRRDAAVRRQQVLVVAPCADPVGRRMSRSCRRWRRVRPSARGVAGAGVGHVDAGDRAGRVDACDAGRAGAAAALDHDDRRHAIPRAGVVDGHVLHAVARRGDQRLRDRHGSRRWCRWSAPPQ